MARLRSWNGFKWVIFKCRHIWKKTSCNPRVWRKTQEAGGTLVDIWPLSTIHQNRTKTENGSISDSLLLLCQVQVHIPFGVCVCIHSASCIAHAFSHWLCKSLKAQRDANKLSGSNKTQVRIIMLPASLTCLLSIYNWCSTTPLLPHTPIAWLRQWSHPACHWLPLQLPQSVPIACGSPQT